MILQKIIAWVKGVIGRMLHIENAKTALKLDVAISPEMQEAIDIWTQAFLNRGPWLDDTTKSAELPSAIAGEFARLVTVEMESDITGSERAAYLAEQYGRFRKHLRETVEVACAVGGAAFKPYVDNGRIIVDVVPAWSFLPTAFNSQKEVIGAVFVEQTTIGRTIYTRMEHHTWEDNGYTIRNLAYKSDSPEALGSQCNLAEVDAWAGLEEELIIKYTDGKPLERPLFAYFRLPAANTVDPGSPLGVSVYSRAIGLIEEADKQYSRILWEYEGSELAIDATMGALQTDATGKPTILPKREKRLFREVNLELGSGGDLYSVYSPAIRDSSLFNGLNQLLKRIEFNCNLAYGTLSDPQNVDKTAEEIKTSKQRSYSAVCDIQEALQSALEDLVWAMDIYASLYKLAPRGKYEVTFGWGDSVLQDTDKEYAIRKGLVDAGYMRPEALLAWYFGTTEEEALKMMPSAGPEIIEEEKKEK